MYELIDELVLLIKNEDVYKEFIRYSKLLERDDIHQLLIDYQFKKDEYTRMRQYEKYQDISNIKEDYLNIKKVVSENEIINNYYNAYYKLNDLLDELTEIIFEGISDDLINERHFL